MHDLIRKQDDRPTKFVNTIVGLCVGGSKRKSVLYKP